MRRSVRFSSSRKNPKRTKSLINELVKKVVVTHNGESGGSGELAFYTFNDLQACAVQIAAIYCAVA